MEGPRARGVFFTVLILCLFLPLFSEIPPVREITFKVLADEEFRQDPGWQAKAGEAVRFVSDEFEKAFGIRFVIKDFAGWTSPDSLRSLELMAEDLDTKAPRTECDVLLAMSAQTNLSGPYSGYSAYKQALVIVKVLPNLSSLELLLKHELAHLFGAVHVDNAASIMDFKSRGSGFDAVNSKAMLLNRERSFGDASFPLPRANQEEAVRLYREIANTNRRSKNGWARIPSDLLFMEGLGPESPDRSVFQNLGDVHSLLAQIFIEMKRYDDALAECESARKYNREDVEALNLMGISLRRKGRLDEAIKKYEEVLKAKPGYVNAYYNLGLAYSKKGDQGSSLLAYRQAIDLKPNFAEAHSNLGELYLRMGKADEAEREFLEAIALNPGFSLAHSNLAESRLRKGDFAGAAEEVEKALSLDPSVPGPHNVKGNIYYKKGRIDRAIEEYGRAVALDPAYEKGHYNLGYCHLDKNEIPEAQACFRRALSLNPDFGEAHAGLGTCLLLEGKTDDAVAELRRSVELGHQTARTALLLSAAYLKKGDFNRAAAEAANSIAMDPSLPQAYNNLGIAYGKKGKPTVALAQFRKALELDPQNKEVLLNLGNTFLQLGMNDPALDHYLRAAAIDPANALLHNNIAVVYFRQADYALSWKHLQKARDLGFSVNPEFLRELEKKINKDFSQTNAPSLISTQ